MSDQAPAPGPRCTAANPITGHRCVFTVEHRGRHAAPVFWGDFTDRSEEPMFVEVVDS